VLFRFTLAGIILTTLSLITEDQTGIVDTINKNLPMLLFNGLFVLSVGKIVWYEALKRLDISKAISLEMTFPIFSLITLVFFFNEKISSTQWIGIGIMMVGVIFSVLRKSADPSKTRYSGEIA